MLKSMLPVIFAMVLGIAFLATLGTWQVKRLAWKDNLIAQTKARATASSVNLAVIEARWEKSRDVDYMTVQLEGTFKHDSEMYYYTTWKGRAGWNVITPLQLADGRYVLLNRGFVPLEMREPHKRQDGQIEGEIQITGLSRNPIDDKPNSLMPDNQLEQREFFWKSQAQLVSLIGGNAKKGVLPFMIDAGGDNAKYQYPQRATTRMEFPNSHLQYAVTWYGLALSLLVVGSIFLYGRRKQVA